MSLELDERYKSRAVLGEVKKPKFVDFLLKHGIVHSEKQAEIVLIFFAVCAFVLALIITWSTFPKDPEVIPPAFDIDARVIRN